MTEKSKGKTEAVLDSDNDIPRRAFEALSSFQSIVLQMGRFNPPMNATELAIHRSGHPSWSLPRLLWFQNDDTFGTIRYAG